MDTTGISSRRGGRRSGYALIEAVLALAITGVAILVAAGLVQSHGALVRRTAVRQELLWSAEDVLEQLRGGARPLDSDNDVEPLIAVGGVLRRTVVVVEPLQPEGLYRVSVTARASVPGESLSVELATMVWRP